MKLSYFIFFLLLSNSVIGYSKTIDFTIASDKKNKKLKIIHFKGQKYLQGKMLGKGAMGHVDIMIPVPSMKKLNYVVKSFSFLGKNVLGIYEMEKKMAKELNKFNLIPKTYFNDHEKMMIKGLIHGETLSTMVERYDKGRKGSVWSDPRYPKLVQFIKKILTTVNTNLSSGNKFLWDLHLNNLMFDDAKKDWFIVDANFGRKRSAELVGAYKGRKGLYKSIFQDWCGSYSGEGLGKNKNDGIGRSIPFLNKLINKIREDLVKQNVDKKTMDYFFKIDGNKDFSEGKYCKKNK